MEADDRLEQGVSGVAALADDVRRRLYRYVCSETAPVGRDQAAEALGLPRHQAKFHLDKLEEAGLLESDYVRLTGRTGPGAGRPAKVYRRAPGEVSVSLPQRDYALAGELMAEAITRAGASGEPVGDALQAVATERGARVADELPGKDDPLARAVVELARLGYEPREEDGRTVMANCPFHALMETHTQLVCTMNHAFLRGMCDRLGGCHAELDPGEGRCCVVLTRE